MNKSGRKWTKAERPPRVSPGAQAEQCRLWAQKSGLKRGPKWTNVVQKVQKLSKVVSKVDQNGPKRKKMDGPSHKSQGTTLIIGNRKVGKSGSKWAYLVIK